MTSLLATLVTVGFAAQAILLFVVMLLAGRHAKLRSRLATRFRYSFPPSRFHTEKGRQVMIWLKRVSLALIANFAVLLCIALGAVIV